MQRGVGGVEDAHDQLLAVHRRGKADAIIDAPLHHFLFGFGGNAGAEVAFLDDVPLGDVDVAYHLDGREKLDAQFLA